LPLRLRQGRISAPRSISQIDPLRTLVRKIDCPDELAVGIAQRDVLTDKVRVRCLHDRRQNESHIVAVLLVIETVAVVEEIACRESYEPAIRLNGPPRTVRRGNHKLRVDFLLRAQIEIVKHHDEKHGVLNRCKAVRNELVIEMSVEQVLRSIAEAIHQTLNRYLILFHA